MSRDHVYIIGAGFSKSLGYPLARELLPEVWRRLNRGDRDRLGRIVQFHHPSFQPANVDSFPNIENLLTAIAVNEEMFDSSRRAVGNFTQKDLANGRKSILVTIEKWFHEIYQSGAAGHAWLDEFRELVQRENAALISFNWDLVLDHLLYGSKLSATSYGFSSATKTKPVLLKPHGSLNWFSAPTLTASTRNEIFQDKAANTTYFAFLVPRSPISKHGRKYEPLLIPPTYMKRFDKPIFRTLWNECTDVLSSAKEIHFLGYSMPDEDRHTQFILHCGLHNQIEGKLKPDGTRTLGTGKAQVTIVNPDGGAFKRTKEVVGPAYKCSWIENTVENWVLRTTQKPRSRV
ncbi:MAG: hypothetical protein KGJ49_01865 [Alphaproteobacteria bacterium]|nr:hypothetical protein [Alphaproteobacteria bacterium]